MRPMDEERIGIGIALLLLLVAAFIVGWMVFS